MSEVVAERHGGETLAKGALASAVLAVLGFFILGFATGGWWFIIGLIFGAVAVILGKSRSLAIGTRPMVAIFRSRARRAISPQEVESPSRKNRPSRFAGPFLVEDPCLRRRVRLGPRRAAVHAAWLG